MSEIDATPEQLRIFNTLKLNPDTMYVTPDGNHLYILSTQGDVEGLLDIERIESDKYFNEMTTEELNEALQAFLKDLTD